MIMLFWSPLVSGHWKYIKNNKQNLAQMQSLNYKIVQTKPNFPLGKREDFHESKSNGSFKIAYRPEFKLVLLFTFWIMLSLRQNMKF